MNLSAHQKQFESAPKNHSRFCGRLITSFSFPRQSGNLFTSFVRVSFAILVSCFAWFVLRKLLQQTCELLNVLKRKTELMSGYTTDDVLASVWNDSGSERSSSDSEFEPGSDSESERDDPGYNLSENGEDTDSSNGSEQSEDEVTNNDANPQQRRKRPRRQQQQQQPALVWTAANRETTCHSFYCEQWNTGTNTRI